MTGDRKFTPTDEQCAIIAAVAEPGGQSLMVQAGAGCSKSTTLQLAAPGVRNAALALAFNRQIANDLKPKLPGHFQIKTFNGLGYGAWMRANPSVGKWELDDKKLGKLVSAVIKDRKIQLGAEGWDNLRQLTSKGFQAGIVPRDEGKGLMADTPENWQAIGAELLLSPDEVEFLLDMAREVMERNNALARRGVISFDDQVYASACLGGKFPQFPTLFVDESQDLSPLNHHQLSQTTRPGGRLVIVGDPRQAIYAFRGADSQSMETLRGLQAKWRDLELNETFRVPKSIVERQLEHYPKFRAARGNPLGRFHHFRAGQSGGVEATGPDWKGWGIGDLIALKPTPEAEIVVLCRNNGPLFALAFKLIAQGVGVVMMGRDIGKGLEGLSRKLAPDDGIPRDEFMVKLLDWKEREMALAIANGDDSKADGIADRFGCLEAIMSNSGVRTAGECRLAIARLFARTEGLITLSSIHKFKGLEREVVVHLDPWRIPSKWAREAAKGGDPRALEQEWNLLYVAETRTKHTLINANLEDFQ